MGGFASFDDNGELKALTPTRFLQHLSSSTFDTPFQFPIISEEDILDKSKGDGLTKAIALFQILWFSIQFVARLAKGWATSELEVLTFATCIIALGIFVLWWSKPLDVKCQTIVKLRPSVEKAEDENEGRGTKADTLAIVEGKPPLTGGCFALSDSCFLTRQLNYRKASLIGLPFRLHKRSNTCSSLPPTPLQTPPPSYTRFPNPPISFHLHLGDVQSRRR